MNWKKICSFLLILTLFSTLLPTNVVATEIENFEVNTAERFENGYRYNVNGWIYLYIEGEPYERGYQHGYLLAPEIVDMMRRWSNVIHNAPIINMFSSIESSNYERISNAWWNFVRKGIEEQFWYRWPEEYRQEIRGIADGVNARKLEFLGRNVDYLDILAINEMYEFMTRFDNPTKDFHPLKELYSILRDLIPSLGDESKFVNSFLNAPPAHHCSGFIATGDATRDGNIVVAQQVLCGGWWYPYYIPQRWNVIMDINPSEGNRFQMSSAPGYIWSDENYYQNEKGICILDTTCPQGLWKKKGGLPMAVRVRKAAQYSESIDDALHYIMDGNDGIWTAVYLIGDTKTGEIARLDLGLYTYQVWRTFNGYYWSANNLKSDYVRAETNRLGIKGSLSRLLSIILRFPTGYEYYTRKYFPADRDRKLDEQGTKYYGKIDVEIVKNKIMKEYPLSSEYAKDLKVSNKQLIENNSLWAYFGSPGGFVWDMSSYRNILAGVRDVPPIGWTLISGVPEGHDVDILYSKYNETPGREKIIWNFDIAKGYEGRNAIHANMVLKDNVLIASTGNGTVYALNAYYGGKLWEQKINDFNSTIWINTDGNLVVAGWENETCALDFENGEMLWRNSEVDLICSKPVFVEGNIIIGSRYGEIFALDREGKIVWKKQFDNNYVYLADDGKDVYATVGNNCYKINGSNGKIIWSYRTDGNVISSACITKDTVYFGSTASSLYAIDKEKGDLKWVTKLGWSIVSTPLIYEDKLYVGSMDNNLYAIGKDNGSILWFLSTNAAIRSSVAAYWNLVFFGSDDGRLYALDKDKGKIDWCFAPNLTIGNDIYNFATTSVAGDVIAYDKIVFASANGMIYALDAQTYEKPVKSLENKKNVPGFTLLFILLSLIAVILLTIIHLIFSKK